MKFNRGKKVMVKLFGVLVLACLCLNASGAAGNDVVDPNSPVKYRDGRPYPKYRMDAVDVGVVLPYGGGPDKCDILGAREAVINKVDDTFYLTYDGAGEKGWLACLATSKDLINWEKKGTILDFGQPGEMDVATATCPWVIKDGGMWHMFYVGSPNATPAPDYIPAGPYLTLKAIGDSITGPWVKQKDVTPFRPKPGTYYAGTASPGHIIKRGDEFLQYFSGQYHAPGGAKRTVSIARTKDLNGPWTIDEKPMLSPEEQIENSSIYYEESNQTWFLFTNHIALDESGEYTDAVWVYWSKDPEKWDAENKAVVLDGRNCIWSKRCIGMPTVINHGSRLALVYDAPGGSSVSHMHRSIGLAFLALPLVPPANK